MARLTRQHALVLFVLVCAGIAAAWIDSRPVDRAAPVTLSAQLKAARPAVRETAAPVVPTLDLERLERRTARAPEGDPFQSRGWTPPEKPVLLPVVEPPPEQAPPVPFTYQGKWTERDQVLVLLSAQGRNYLARAGETLDGTYRVEAIEAGRLVLTYLPLGVRQTLAFDRAPAEQAASARVRVAALARGADQADALLRVVMPAQAGVAEEFTILLTLDPRQTANIERGSVEVVYDPKVLSAGGRGTPGSAAPPDAGHVAVELGGGHVGHAGAATAVRMRVIAAAPTTTEVALALPNASDAEGVALAVAVDGPNPRTIVIGQPRAGATAPAGRNEPRPPH